MSKYEGGLLQNEGKGRHIGLPKKREGTTSHGLRKRNFA